MGSKVQAEETLYRAIKRSKPDWLDDNNKPTSAMYKDIDGNSVDREGNRILEDVIKFMKTVTFPNRLKGIVKISAGDCINIGAVVEEAPTRDNPFHANIFLNTEDEKLVSLRALMLADQSEVVYMNEEMKWVHIT